MNVFAIFKKDWESELRTRYAINALAMFILVTISVILFSIGQEKVSEPLTGGLFGGVLFFLIFQLIVAPSMVYFGKLFVNLVLVFIMYIAIVVLYFLLFESFVIMNISLFLLSLLLGSIGIAISSTLIAAIISKANTKGTLYPVLSFPILLPLILTLMELTKFAMDGDTISKSYAELMVLVSYDVIMGTAGFMLFDFIWKD